MEQRIEQPQPPEGDGATTGTMSPLAAVRQYLFTNSAKSTFLRNSGLVVKVTKGVQDYGVLECPGYVIWAGLMGRGDIRRKTFPVSGWDSPWRGRQA